MDCKRHASFHVKARASCREPYRIGNDRLVRMIEYLFVRLFQQRGMKAMAIVRLPIRVIG